MDVVLEPEAEASAALDSAQRFLDSSSTRFAGAGVGAVPPSATVEFDVVCGDGPLTFELDRGGKTCASVAPGAAAAAAGLRKGDVLSAVSGLAIAELSGEEVLALLAAKVRPMILTFARPREPSPAATAADAAAGAAANNAAVQGLSGPAAAGSAEERRAAQPAADTDSPNPHNRLSRASGFSEVSMLTLLRARFDVVRVLAPVIMVVSVLCAVTAPLCVVSCTVLFLQGRQWVAMAQSSLAFVRDTTAELVCCGCRIRGGVGEIRTLAALTIGAAVVELIAIQVSAWIKVLASPFASTRQSGQLGSPQCYLSSMPGAHVWLIFTAGQSVTCAIVNIAISILTLQLLNWDEDVTKNMRILQRWIAVMDKTDAKAGGHGSEVAVAWEGAGSSEELAMTRIDRLERVIRDLREELAERGNRACCDECCHPSECCCCCTRVRGSRHKTLRSCDSLSPVFIILISVSIIGAVFGVTSK